MLEYKYYKQYKYIMLGFLGIGQVETIDIEFKMYIREY